MGYFVAGNVWLIIALVLLLGKNNVRIQPTFHSFFGVGGWYSPGAYWLMIVACAALGVGFLNAAWRKQQTNSDSKVTGIWTMQMAEVAFNGFLVSGVVLGLIGAMIGAIIRRPLEISPIGHVSLIFGLVGGVIGAIVAVVFRIIRVSRGVSD